MSDEKNKEANGVNEYLKGCTICNEGMANSMDRMMDKHNLSETAAAQATADSVNKRIGVDMFTGDALRKRYRRQRGKADGSDNFKPRGKEKKPWQCQNGKTIQGNLNIVRKELKKAIKLAAIDSETGRKIYNLSHEIAGLVKPLINWEEN